MIDVDEFVDKLWKEWTKAIPKERINLKWPSLKGIVQWYVRECDIRGLDPQEAIDLEAQLDPSLTYLESKKILESLLTTPLTDKEADVMYEQYKTMQEKQIREKYPELVEEWTGKIADLEREVTRGKKRLKKIKLLERELAEVERKLEEKRVKAPPPPPKELTADEIRRLADVFKAELFRELGKVPPNALALFRVEMERIKMAPYEEAKTAVETLAKEIITREAWRKRVRLPPPPPRVVRVGVPPEPRVVVGIPPAYPPKEPDPEAVPFPRAPSSRERVEFEKAFRYRLQERGISYFEYMKKFEDYIVRTVFKSWKHMLEMFDLFTDAIIKGERLPPLRLWKGVPVPYGLRPLLRAEAEITEIYESMLEAEEARDMGRPDYEFVRIIPEPEITVVWRSTKPFRELIEPVQYNSIVKAATVVIKNAKFFRKTPTLKDIRVKLEEEFGIIATEQDIKDIVRDAWKNKELLPTPWFTTITLEELDEIFK